eukprot:gene6917-11080_t
MSQEEDVFLVPSLNISKEEYKKMEKEIYQVYKELLSTEKTYVKNLNNCFYEFYQPIQKFLKLKNFMEIFINFEKIKQVNEKFLHILEGFDSFLDYPEKIPSMDEFQSKMKEFIYAHYTQNFKISKEKLNLLTEKEIFQTFLKETNLKFYDLNNYLILPIQRIPRYELLFKQILKYFPQYDDCLTKIQYICSYLNEKNPRFSTCIFSHKIDECCYAIQTNFAEENAYLFDTKKTNPYLTSIKLPLCRGDSSTVWETQRNQFGIFYISEEDQLIYTYFSDENKWKYDIDSLSKSVIGKPAAVYEPQRNHSACFVPLKQGGICYYFVTKNKKNENEWSIDDQSITSNCTGDTSAVFETHRNHSSLCCDVYGILHYWFVEKTWKCLKFDKIPIGGAISSVYDENENITKIYFMSKNGNIVFISCKSYLKEWSVSIIEIHKPIFRDFTAFYNPKLKCVELIYSTVGGFEYIFDSDGSKLIGYETEFGYSSIITVCITEEKVKFMYIHKKSKSSLNQVSTAGSLVRI